jgi:hypothetical protein
MAGIALPWGTGYAEREGDVERLGCPDRLFGDGNIGWGKRLYVVYGAGFC